jgi:insulysin
MPDEKFESIKRALKVQKLPVLLTLSDQFWQYFKEIASQQYHFNRANVEASVLRKITKEEILEFYNVRKKNKISI